MEHVYYHAQIDALNVLPWSPAELAAHLMRLLGKRMTKKIKHDLSQVPWSADFLLTVKGNPLLMYIGEL